MEKVTQFVRSLVMNESVPRSVREEAMDLLIQISGGTLEVDKVVKVDDKEVFIPRKAWQTIDDFLAQDKKIQAIKELRSATGWGLKESKDAVESKANFPHAITYPPTPPFNPAYRSSY